MAYAIIFFAMGLPYALVSFRMRKHYASRVQFIFGSILLLAIGQIEGSSMLSWKLLALYGALAGLRTNDMGIADSMKQVFVAMSPLLLVAWPLFAILAEEGLSPLHKAASQGSLDKLRIAMAEEPNLNRRDHKGRTALMRAASAGSLEMVCLLLDRGANPLLRAHSGDTAESFARRRGFDAIAAAIAHGPHKPNDN